MGDKLNEKPEKNEWKNMINVSHRKFMYLSTVLTQIQYKSLIMYFHFVLLYTATTLCFREKLYFLFHYIIKMLLIRRCISRDNLTI